MEDLCTSNCKSKRHADRVFLAIPKNWECDDLQYKFLSSCVNAGITKDSFGRTALHLAASFGKVKLIEWLLQRKSQILAKDDESGYSALHRAFFYGQLHAARTLLKNEANLFQPVDNEKWAPLDHVIQDRLTWKSSTEIENNELYVWGTNTNYTLGLGDQKTKTIPELLDRFEHNCSGFKQVCLDKYHTVFITLEGEAFSCGLGQGGKLGNDSASNSIFPGKITLEMNNLNCKADSEPIQVISASVGQSHTLLLTNIGRVWSCGMNQYGQLGLGLSTTHQLLTPKCLTVFIDKSKTITSIRGICASRFHSVFWSSQHVFTCGLNAGALGHSKGEKIVATPKQVIMPSGFEGHIKLAACSESATAIATSKGDVYVLHEYQCRKIASKQAEITKITMIGGNLDSIHKDVSNLNAELQIVILTGYGRALLWSEVTSSLTRIVFVGGQQLVVKDLTFNKSCMALVSNNGEAFTGTILHRGEKLKTLANSLQPKNSKEALACLRANAHVKISRIPCISRAVGIASDPEGKNFVITQAHPYNGFTRRVAVDPSTLKHDLTQLLLDTDETDALHDITFHVGSRNFAAHRYIISTYAKSFFNEFCSNSSSEASPQHCHVNISGASAEQFQQILCFIYTGSCEFLKRDSAYWTKHLSLGSNTKTPSDTTYSTRQEETPAEFLSALRKLSKKFKINSLEKILEKVRIGSNNSLIIEKPIPLNKPLSRLTGEEFYDVKIKCGGDIEFEAHRAVLSARVEYFRSMFSLGWIESSKIGTVNLPVQSSVFRVVLDYIYEDKASEIEKSSDISWIMECLVIADQLLLTRLVSICELALSGLLTLKNVGQMLEFSAMYNASQLKTSCMDFICRNLPAIVEQRLWDNISESVMDDLAFFYQQSNPALLNRCSSLAGAIITAEEFFSAQEMEPKNVSLNRSDSSSPRKQEIKRTKVRRKSNRKISESKETQSLPLATTELSNLSLNSDTCGPLPQEIPTPNTTNWVKVDKQRKRNKSESLKSPLVIESNKPSLRTSSTSGDGVACEISGRRERTKSTSVQINEPIDSEDCWRPSKQTTLFDLATVTQLKIANSPESPKASKGFRKVSQRQRKQLEAKEKENSPSISSSSSSNLSNINSQSTSSSTTPPEFKSAWKTIPTVDTQPIVLEKASLEKHDTSPMKNILADEEERRRNLAKVKSKPLTLTLIEDKAIEELEKFYNVHGVFDEYIFVERVSSVVAVPVWSVSRASEHSRQRIRQSSTSAN